MTNDPPYEQQSSDTLIIMNLLLINILKNVFFLSMKLELSPSKKSAKEALFNKKKRELCKTLPKIPSYECQMIETHARITVIM